MSARLELLDGDREADRHTWIDLWTASPMQSPFAHPEVCRLLGPARAKLMAAVWTEGHGRILYPFFLRRIEGPRPHSTGTISGHRRLGELGGEDDLSDIVTPYGYGGPLQWGLADPARSAAAFWDEFDTWAHEHRVVSEFVRCSLFTEQLVPYPGTLRERQTNFIRTLDMPLDELWSGVSSKVRRNVRRAVSEGVEVVVDTEGGLIDEFLRIYLATMDRRSSADWYRFDRAFFDALHAALPGRFVYVFARHEGRLISADLLLNGGDTSYYFLGGTDESAYAVRPNDFVKWEVMGWLRQAGYRHYVLGGGVSSGDGLERYKRGFAPEGGVTFLTGERVFAASVYERLSAARSQKLADNGLDADEGFFPAYRQGGDLPSDSELETVRV